MQSADDTLSLRVPNRLMFTWYRDKISASQYLSLVNVAVLNQIVQLKTENSELAQKLYRRASSVYGTAKKKSGRVRMEFLNRNSIIAVSHHDIIKVPQLQEEIEQLEDQIADLEHDFTLAMEELVHSQEAVEHMSTQLNQVLRERDEVVNTGRAYEDVGAKQKKRKLVQFQRAADAALWFGESFGLIPTQLTVQTTSDEAISIPLNDSSAPVPDAQPTREVDEFCAMQTLYLLDRFGVSDEFYHELTQVCHFKI